MAKKVKAIVKLALNAGKATPAPPVGPALAQHGVNLMGFVKEYNARTANRIGEIIPAEITIFQDGSFKFILKSPPTSFLILKALGVQKGATNPLTQKVGKLTRAQVQTIAEIKKDDMNALDLEAAMRQVAGTARQMGVEVDL
ncbi:MAG: 50S ribosomal protein L11 [Anaerolineae bacterium]|jgi:large subunit ribosomal protein L11|nr:50S ribosomal protein L11 [Anaerolineae bacterium]